MNGASGVKPARPEADPVVRTNKLQSWFVGRHPSAQEI